MCVRVCGCVCVSVRHCLYIGVHMTFTACTHGTLVCARCACQINNAGRMPTVAACSQSILSCCVLPHVFASLPAFDVFAIGLLSEFNLITAKLLRLLAGFGFYVVHSISCLSGSNLFQTTRNLVVHPRYGSQARHLQLVRRTCGVGGRDDVQRWCDHLTDGSCLRGIGRDDTRSVRSPGRQIALPLACSLASA